MSGPSVVRALTPTMKQLGSATRTIVVRGKLTEDKLPSISNYFSSFGKVLSVDFSRVLPPPPPPAAAAAARLLAFPPRWRRTSI